MPGWVTSSGRGIEIQTARVGWAAADGDQMVELDSHPAPAASCMAQDLSTVAGVRYELIVAHSARPRVRDNRIEVRWEGLPIAVLDDDGSARAQTLWRAHRFEVEATADGSRLEFCDASEENPTHGGLLDDVSVRSLGGELTCDATPGDPAPEECNGIDDDCDGEVDEGLLDCCPGEENECGGCGAVPVEICDGLDNDCDGQTDEGVTNACGECGDVPAEVCDGLDNDCDGEVDEGVANACGECGDVPAEVCNDADDDCDGDIDEDLGVGEVCVVGQGACEREGRTQCAPGQNLVVNSSFEIPVVGPAWDVFEQVPGWLTTSGRGIEVQTSRVGWAAAHGDQMVELDSHPAPASSCMAQDLSTTAGVRYEVVIAHSARPRVRDNRIEVRWEGQVLGVLDDNGEGRAQTLWRDHRFEVEATADGSRIELCDRTGEDQPTHGGLVDNVRVRSIDGVACDAEPGEPSLEACNGIDDDCDGVTDEGLDDCCPGQENACGGCGPVPAEICNGLDDDCDGEIDEGLPLEICPRPRCVERDGVCQDQCPEGFHCDEACSFCEPDDECTPETEVCNGQDDDCDGEVDEGVTNACGECGDVPAEVCDKIDNDCDGEVDEGVTNACGGCGPVPAEICNGLDDDCDGRIDEGLPIEICPRPSCVIEDGVCVDRCPDGSRCSPDCDFCEPDDECTPEAEVCDGQDNDCDGEVDEGVTNACGGCGPVPGEICNRLDDDCDGRIDEGLPLEICPRPACVIEDGVCQDRCPDGSRCSPDCDFCEPDDECTPEAEVCDGQDNDCDGEVDEGVTNACGGCGPVPGEICNRLDDDCDGRIDEGLPIEVCPRPRCFVQDGVCQDQCPAGSRCSPDCGFCEPEEEPGCNIVGNVCEDNCPDGTVCDDDCDTCIPRCLRHGDRCVDECPAGMMCDAECGACVDVPCRQGPEGQCIDGCPEGTACSEDCSECVPECQAIGDRCEDNCPDGFSCNDGCGACVPSCQQVDDRCEDNCPRGTVCDQDCGACVPGDPGCSLQDDICVDNCPPLTACSADCARCEPVPECRRDEAGVCVDECPAGFVCDGECGACVPGCNIEGNQCVDNCPVGSACNQDCNACVPQCFRRGDLCVDNCPEGTVCGQDCGVCEDEAPGCRVEGDQCIDECGDGEVCNAACDGCIPCDRVEEVCDGVDNNCNGLVDEGLLNACGTCGPAPAEVCDGQDNDCNGAIDDLPGVGEPCTAGVGTCEQTGRMVCDPETGGLRCSVQAGDPIAEICDGEDNDCDGRIDEDLTRSCYGGPAGTEGVGVCRGGTQQCVNGAWNGCDGEVLPGNEICNGFDDDCDGQVDEMLRRACYTGPAGTLGVGVCRRGEQVCDSGDWGDCAGEVVPAAEICNGEDDDCNGRVDDGPMACDPGAQETCNQTDDDGDGRVDEGVQNACGTCGPVVECPGNGVDDDCDGVVDEADPAYVEGEVFCAVDPLLPANPRKSVTGTDLTDNCSCGFTRGAPTPWPWLMLLLGVPALRRRRR